MRYSPAKQAALELADKPVTIATDETHGFVIKSDEPATGTQSAYGLATLLGMGSQVNHRGAAQHVYGGTVPPAEVSRRRAANKVARRSRRANRR